MSHAITTMHKTWTSFKTGTLRKRAFFHFNDLVYLFNVVVEDINRAPRVSTRGRVYGFELQHKMERGKAIQYEVIGET